MGRMALGADGNMVPIEELLSEVDLQRMRSKKRKVEPSIPEPDPEAIVEGQSSKDVLTKAPSTNTSEGLQLPEGCSECGKPDVECGLRQKHYCTMAPGQPCDFDTEAADIKSGTEKAPPMGKDRPREIVDHEPPAFNESSEAELRAKRKKHAARFDNLAVPALKKKCDKLGIAYKSNTQKKTLIKKIKEIMDAPEEVEESAASKL